MGDSLVLDSVLSSRKVANGELSNFSFKGVANISFYLDYTNVGMNVTEASSRAYLGTCGVYIEKLNMCHGSTQEQADKKKNFLYTFKMDGKIPKHRRNNTSVSTIHYMALFYDYVGPNINIYHIDSKHFLRDDSNYASADDEDVFGDGAGEHIKKRTLYADESHWLSDIDVNKWLHRMYR